MIKMTNAQWTEFAPKDMTFGEKARKLMLSAAEKQAMAVGATMGPAGKFVIFESIDQCFPKCTKDGVTVSKQVIPIDERERMASTLIMQAADKQVKQSGDGTTLTTILTYHMLKGGLEQENTGQALRDIDEAVNIAIQHLKDTSTPIKTEDELIQIATISSNGDAQLGRLIGGAVWKTGMDGVVDHRVHDSLTHDIDFQEGYNVRQGFMFLESQNVESGVEYKDCLVLVSAEPMEWAKEFQPLINDYVEAYKDGVIPPLVIVCPELKGDIPSNVLGLMKKTGIQICWIKPEGIATSKDYCLKDICAISGANLVSDETGLQMRDATVEDLGYLKLFKSNKDSSILFSDDSKDKKNRIEMLNNVKKQTEDPYLKDLIDKSTSKLKGRIAIIKVGGNSESSQKETQDRVDDAILACKSAMEEGISNGGGVELLRASKLLSGWMVSVLFSPAKQILNNAHIEPDYLLNDILTGCVSGYDIELEIVTDAEMKEMGIIDPTKVLRTALINSADIAKLMLNGECLITISEEFKEQLRRG